MNRWISTALEYVKLALHNPSGIPETVALGIVGLITAVLILMAIGKALSMAVPTPIRSTATIVISLLTIAATVTAGDILLIKHISSSAGFNATLTAIAVITLLAIAAPTCCFFLKTKYVNAVAALTLSMAGGFAAVMLVQAVFNAVISGGKTLDKAVERKEEQQLSNIRDSDSVIDQV